VLVAAQIVKVRDVKEKRHKETITDCNALEASGQPVVFSRAQQDGDLNSDEDHDRIACPEHQLRVAYLPF
jgi:hypothetical protein